MENEVAPIDGPKLIIIEEENEQQETPEVSMVGGSVKKDSIHHDPSPDKRIHSFEPQKIN
jgi:hypothetical protein